MDQHYTIYGSSISLFTRKLEAAMQFYGVPFSITRKTDDEREAIEQRSGTHQIPVLRTPENWMLGDTTPIMMMLDARYPQRRLLPLGPLGVLVHIIEEVLDEWMARTMVHYRWHYDENVCAVTSELLQRETSIEDARQVPLAQWGLRACRATGTELPSQQGAAEREYLAILSALSQQLETTRFAAGDRPCAIDAIIIGSLRGHTNKDPYPNLNEFRTVLAWDDAVNNYAPKGGEWANFPDSTPFVAHMLELARQCYKPFILGNAAALANGTKAFYAETYGEQVSYLCRPYPERSRRMIIDRVQHQLESRDRTLVEKWLRQIELDECFLTR